AQLIVMTSVETFVLFRIVGKGVLMETSDGTALSLCHLPFPQLERIVRVCRVIRALAVTHLAGSCTPVHGIIDVCRIIREQTARPHEP
uniref:hypothetical protein n=1 Tax=Pseudomonas aeruginosa TaxID=287 RepID=UPI00397C2C0A